jgi:hypothetical protein
MKIDLDFDLNCFSVDYPPRAEGLLSPDDPNNLIFCSPSEINWASLNLWNPQRIIDKIKVYMESGDTEKSMNAFIRLGFLLFIKKSFADSKKVMEDLVKNFSIMIENPILAEIFYILAICSYKEKNLVDFRTNYEKCLTISYQVENDPQTIKYNKIFADYEMTLDPERAKQMYQNRLKKTNDEIWKIK